MSVHEIFFGTAYRLAIHLKNVGEFWDIPFLRRIGYKLRDRLLGL